MIGAGCHAVLAGVANLLAERVLAARLAPLARVQDASAIPIGIINDNDTFSTNTSLCLTVKPGPNPVFEQR